MRYSMAVLKVQDLSVWKQHYHSDDSKAARKAAGEKTWQLFHVADDANAVLLLNEWSDEATAMAFLKSERLREFQQASGVIEVKQVLLFGKVEKGTL